MSPRCLPCLFAFLLCTLPALGFAHGQSTALLQVDVREGSQPSGRVQLDLALADLQQAFGLDRDADGSLTWGELRAQAGDVASYVGRHLTLRAGDGDVRVDCPLSAPEVLVDEHADGPYAVFVYTTDCLRGGRIDVDYRLLFEIDSAHRVLARLSVDGDHVSSDVLSESAPHVTWTVGSTGFLSGFASWVSQGVWHIWTGLDHILFLATLLLAAGTVIDVVRIVTAFTLSHSLTLVCGALGMLRVDPGWVEAAIALTVLLGAVNLVFPLVRRRLWLLALVFGLVHGLGFASVLAGLQLRGVHLARDLVGFNLGVEIGQLAIVLALVPLVRAQRERRWYRRAFQPGVATAIGITAAVWMVQRLA